METTGDKVTAGGEAFAALEIDKVLRQVASLALTPNGRRGDS